MVEVAATNPDHCAPKHRASDQSAIAMFSPFLIGAKIKRMPFIAGNGILILIPSALFLAAKADAVDLMSSIDRLGQKIAFEKRRKAGACPL